MEIQKEKEILRLLKDWCLTENLALKKLKAMEKARLFCEFLEDNGIHYDICIKHKEVLGCDESSLYYQRFKRYLQSDYVICKNLLVHERKGEKRNLLIVTDSKKKVDLSALKEVLDCKKLEFVKEEEMKKLVQAKPGDTSIFNMIYDKDRQVNLVIDEELIRASLLAFHPLYNGMSLFLAPQECLKFVKLIHKEANIIPIPEKREKGFEKRLAG